MIEVEISEYVVTEYYKSGMGNRALGREWRIYITSKQAKVQRYTFTPCFY